MKKSNKLFMLILIVVILLFGATTMLANMTLAKYKSESTGSDAGRVAEFDITPALLENGTATESIKVNISPDASNKSHTYKVTITNNSEVKINLTVGLTNVTNNMPLAFLVNETPDAFSKTLDFKESIELTIVIKWDENFDNDNFANNFLYQDKVDKVNILVTCEQA